MALYGSARDEWRMYPKRVAEPFARGIDGDAVERLRAVLADETESFAETLRRVARISDEWRSGEPSPRERERLGRLLFAVAVEVPGSANSSWMDLPAETREVFRASADELIKRGYRRIDASVTTDQRPAGTAVG